MKKFAVLSLVVFCAVSALGGNVELRATRIDNAIAGATWGDYNGDGLDDQLYRNELQWNIGGAFASPILVPAFNELKYSVGGANDFNGDGYADVFMLSKYGDADLLFLGDGRGGFVEHFWPSEYGRVVKTVDVTNDGRVDVLTQTPGQKITILRNDGTANFTLHQDLPWTDSTELQIAVGDLNGDGFSDIAAASLTELHIFYGNADGVYGAPRVRFTRRRFTTLNIVDVTGDARNDVAGLHAFEASASPTVLAGDGAGLFPNTLRLRTNVPASGDLVEPSNVVAADLMQGGGKELAVSEADGTVHLLSAAGGQLRDLGTVKIDSGAPSWAPEIGPVLSIVRFRSADRDDVIVEGYSPDRYRNTPRRVWLIEATGSIATAQSATHGRTRAVAGHAERVAGSYRVDMLESTCPLPLTSLRFDQEGMFLDVGLDERIRRAEAIVVDGRLYLRLTVIDDSGIPRELKGTLRRSDVGYAGTLYEDGATPCGQWQSHKLALVPAQ